MKRREAIRRKNASKLVETAAFYGDRRREERRSYQLSRSVQFKPKPAALIHRRFNPDLATHAPDPFLDDRKPNARAGVISGAQPSEELEDFVLVLGGNANAVVLDPDSD